MAVIFVMGPLVPLVMFGVPYLSWGLFYDIVVRGHHAGSSFETAVRDFGFAIWVSYVIGALPAAVTALMVGRLISQSGTFTYLNARAVVLISALLSLVAAQILAFYFDPVFRMLPALAMMLFVAACGLSAIACRWLIDRLGLLPPGSPPANKS